jgi:hypothetical protein
LVPILVPWLLAACLALALAQAARLCLVLRSEDASLRSQGKLADIELRSVRNQLEVERILDGREISGARDALAESKERIAELNRTIKAQADLARFRISTLGSVLAESPRAQAIAVWDPLGQTGVLEVSGMPAAPAGGDYQLWIIDPADTAPVDAGVFGVDPVTGSGRSTFKAAKRVGGHPKFAVSVEPRGGSPEPVGKFVLIGD